MVSLMTCFFDGDESYLFSSLLLYDRLLLTGMLLIYILDLIINSYIFK